MRSYGSAHSRPGCAMSLVECDKGRRCQPAEVCKLGKQVFRDKYTGGGHHHTEEGDREDELTSVA